MRRGFLKLYLLKLLGESPEGLSGYELMKRIEEETGFWQPSPGSVYPLLAALENNNLIHHQAEANKKIYSLTTKGREAMAKAREAKEEALEGVRRSIQVVARIFGEEVPEDLAEPPGMGPFIAGPPELRQQVWQLRGLIHELLSRELTEKEVEEITEILDETSGRLKAYVKGD